MVVNLDQLIKEVVAELGQDTGDRNIAWTMSVCRSVMGIVPC